MIIKKYVAKTEAEARAEAVRELGPGIVIMNVRPVKAEGVFALLRRPRVEVTAALEDEPEDIPVSGSPRSAAAKERERAAEMPQPRQVVPQKPREVSPAERLVQATREGTLPPLGGGTVRTAPAAPVPPRSTFDAIAADGVETPKQIGHVAGNANATAVQRPVQNSAGENAADVGTINKKLDSLHNLLEERMGSSAQEKKSESGPEQPNGVSEEMLTFVKLLYNTLLSNEVDEIYANQLTDEVEKMNKPNLPLEYVLANVYQKMVLKFGKSEVIEPAADGGPKVVFFIGPTGVGKTTTIAKLASELYFMQHKKVALLTVDTYRIAATDQLKSYAAIIEIPFRVIYSPEEILKAAEDLSDYDFLLVDTAGHSMHNEEQRSAIGGFLRAFDGVRATDVFLVLSATTKYKDLIDIVDTYSAMTKYKLLFTKLDETGATGNLYNIKLHTGAPMSYITNGQDVPDDIAVFDAQGVVKALLGGKKGLETRQA
ncbi:MAG: flagellar biosynthesis protein FlhF [Lachnospiraceae bacterium]|nr:flagellar biosynthesis protein FlhF [Lachnospiraceae bacterium]